MRKALLIVAGVLLVGAGVHRFRHQLSAAVKLPAALVVLSWSGLFAPWDWIWDRVTEVADDIKNWVLGLVNDVYRWAQDAVNWVWSALGDLGRWVGHALDAISEFVQSLWRDLVHWVGAAIDAVTRFVSQLWHDLSRWVSAIFDQLARWASEAFNAVFRWIEGLPKWLYDNIVRPLWDAVMWVWHEVVEPAVRWLAGLVGDVWRWVTGLAKQLWGVVGGILDWIWKWATRLLRVVEKCYDWLVMLAEHGPGWVIHQVTDAVHRAPDWFAHGLLSALTARGDVVERFIADWLG